MSATAHKFWALFSTLVGVALLASFVPLMDMLSEAYISGGILLTLVVMAMLAATGVAFIWLGYRIYKR